MDVKRFSEKIDENVNQKTMKFSFDVHGVIDALPEVFAFLSQSIVKNNGEVHILTGASWTDELTNQLKSKGITWSHSFSIYDHLLNSGTEVIGEIQFPDGKVQKKFQDALWDRAKSDYCRSHNISLHIDDTLIYNESFTTPFARLWSHNNKPKPRHKDTRHLD